MIGTQHELVVPDVLDGRRLDQVLAELMPDYSRSRIKQWILDGSVQLDGVVPAPRTRVAAGQTVSVALAPAPDAPSSRAESMPLPLVYADEHLLVIDKPAGLVVHPGAGNASGTLENGLLAFAPELAALPRSGLLHRLDKDTTGLLIVARTLAAHAQLVRDLEARRITREYRAICVGRMTAGGSVEAVIGRHPTQRTKMAVVDRGRRAVTHYRVLGRLPHHTFIALRLDTGRTHQVRVHMAHLRHPLLGDPAYGGRLIVPAGAAPELAQVLRSFRRQALHAYRLLFAHPVSDEPLDLVAPLPADFRNLLAALAGGEAAARKLEDLPWPSPPPSRLPG